MDVVLEKEASNKLQEAQETTEYGEVRFSWGRWVSVEERDSFAVELEGLGRFSSEELERSGSRGLRPGWDPVLSILERRTSGLGRSSFLDEFAPKLRDLSYPTLPLSEMLCEDNGVTFSSRISVVETRFTVNLLVHGGVEQGR